MPLDTPPPAYGLSPVGQAIVSSFQRDEGASLSSFTLTDLIAKVAFGALPQDAPQAICAVALAAHIVLHSAGIEWEEFMEIIHILKTRGLLKMLDQRTMTEAQDFNRSVTQLMSENMEDLLDAMPDVNH